MMTNHLNEATAHRVMTSVIRYIVEAGFRRKNNAGQPFPESIKLSQNYLLGDRLALLKETEEWVESEYHETGMMILQTYSDGSGDIMYTWCDPKRNDFYIFSFES